MAYKVIFIDWFRTLSSSLFFVAEDEESIGVCSYFRRKTFQNNEEMIEKWLLGKVSKKDVIAAFAKDDEEYKMALKMLKKSCEDMKFDRACFIPLIQEIRKKGIKVVIATDNMDVFTDYVVPALNLDKYFDAIISSNMCGFKKMDIKSNRLIFFDNFLKNNNIKYNQALMIDDSFQTLISCQKCGLPVYPIKSPEDVEYILRRLAGK